MTRYIFIAFYIVFSSISCAVLLTATSGQHFTMPQTIGFMSATILAVSIISGSGWLVSRRMSRPMAIGLAIIACCALTIFVEFTGGVTGPMAGINIIMLSSMATTIGVIVWDQMLRQMLAE